MDTFVKGLSQSGQTVGDEGLAMIIIFPREGTLPICCWLKADPDASAFGPGGRGDV